MPAELVMAFLVIALDHSLLERLVHSFDLPIGPEVVWLGQPVFDLMAPADVVEGMATPGRGRSFPVSRQIGERDAVISEHDVDPAGDCRDRFIEEGRLGGCIGLLDQSGEGGLGGAVGGNEQKELAFLGTDFGDVDMEEAAI